MPGTRHSRTLAALLMLVLPALVGCGAGKRGSAEVPADGIDYRSLGGKIRVDGSSTVFPISEAVAEDFRGAAGRVRINVAFSGTGGGFEKFCRGETEVSDASRPIKESERKACADNGITDVLELQVAIDALTVVVSPQNTWATCMTAKELNLTFRNGGAKKWSDIRPEWPDENIKLFFPGPDSGTFDYFKEAVITGIDKESKHRADGTPSEDDNVLALGVEKDRYAIGYFGFAYFEEAGKHLHAVEIDGGKGCVAPSKESALAGSYIPLSRPLFIYTRESFLRDRPEMLGFIKFYLDNMGALADEVGYIPLTPEGSAAQLGKIAPFLPR